MMDFSVIIPVYNCKAYLEECVNSILAANLSEFEIILIDDGSTDGSSGICDALAEKHPAIRVIHQENRGVSAARNRGIREAIGEYIFFADADDRMDSAALGAILTDPRCKEADLSIFGLSFDYYYHRKCYRRDPLFFEYDGILNREHWSISFCELFAKNALSPVWNKVYRRSIMMDNEIMLDTGMFLYEDLEFVLRYLPFCEKIWNVPAAVYHYRQPEDEGNAGRRLTRIESLNTFLEPIEAALNGLTTVSKEQKDTVLQQLYLVLAREKIAVSNIAQIKRICRDFMQWAEHHDLPLKPTQFQNRLREEKAGSLLLQAKKTALRHKIAVWAKRNGIYKRGG